MLKVQGSNANLRRHAASGFGQATPAPNPVRDMPWYGQFGYYAALLLGGTAVYQILTKKKGARN